VHPVTHAIDALRQHLRDDVRIHGIITDGGKAPNVVPDFAAANFMLRSRDRAYLNEVVDKVRRVAEGAAHLTGARIFMLDARANRARIDRSQTTSSHSAFGGVR
jgi:metal-dependent amidase/aminoacylase/carboxypeptidase family protein